MYKTVKKKKEKEIHPPKKENHYRFVLNVSLTTPSAASFLVTEEREKPLPNRPYWKQELKTK